MSEDEVVQGDVIDPDDYAQDEEARQRDWIPWLALLLVLLVIGWLICRYSEFGKAPDVDDVGGVSIRLARVPDVVGLSQEEAERALTAAGFNVEVEQSFDAVALAGEVVSQDPAAGQRAASGSTIFIGVSAGSGMTPGQEAIEGMDRGLHLPDVTGLPVDEARGILEAEGYVVTVSEVFSASVPEGEVAEQTPVGGSAAEAGQQVGLMVSAGDAPPESYTVPELVGMSREQALAAVRAAGLEPRVMYQPQPDAVGKVYQQSPAPGTAVPPDRYVFLMVGARP